MANGVKFYLETVCAHTLWVTFDTSARSAAGSSLPSTVTSHRTSMLSVSRECNYSNDLFRAEPALPSVIVLWNGS